MTTLHVYEINFALGVCFLNFSRYGSRLRLGIIIVWLAMIYTSAINTAVIRLYIISGADEGKECTSRIYQKIK